ncbi:MAG: leucine--tRNA ligase [Christensenellales bacterium]
MDFKTIEKKWQQKWADTKLYSFDKSRMDKKYYVLEMFSYPSGAKLHAGHWFNYGPADSYARFMRMQGYEVFQPMGFDAFGLPAENYAIKTGIHPEDSTLKNIATMEQQLKAMGATFDWDYEIKTCMPDYYKWTQWIFLQLYKHGLAYRKEAPVNWCPSCNTVLANEQVVNGECERCGSTVIRKNLTQWFFKITDYSEQLLEGLNKLDWPEKTKLMQKNWIGKSFGSEIEFKTEEGESFKVFTTRADTIYGVSYVVLAPEHPLVDKITTKENKEAVENYKLECSKATEIDRLSTTREKSGVLTGAYAINPVNGEKVPILIADYVLATYGTGAVMGVPSHDERDFAFATKYNLPIKRVIKSADGSPDDLPFCEKGVLVDSEEFSGMKSEDAIKAITAKLEKEGKGKLKTNYRLRDWLVSRQRYWGAPIPVVYCDHCGIVPVPEKDLPVKLPYNVDFTPDGKSPLLKCEEFMNTTCPVCGRPARRDPDTLDTFVCSSWYYLRYPDNKNDSEPFNTELINKMLPVDKYIGGAEHACMHLLYARFITKALKDMGYIDFDEPFLSLVHQGTILGPDGNKMSKSRGNVVSPDDCIQKYSSDIFRLYLMFCFSYVEGGPWNESGLEGIQRFLDRVERLVAKADDKFVEQPFGKDEKELNFVRNSTVKLMTENIKAFSFNTAIARLMEFVNAMYNYDKNVQNKNKLFYDCIKDIVLLIAPLAPHFAEELNERLGGEYSVFNQAYPTYDEKALVLDEVELAIQVNSKIKGKVTVSKDASNEEIEKAAKEVIASQLEGVTVKKAIIIKGRIINFIV